MLANGAGLVNRDASAIDGAAWPIVLRLVRAWPMWPRLAVPQCYLLFPAHGGTAWLTWAFACPPCGHGLRGARAVASARVAGVIERIAGCVPVAARRSAWPKKARGASAALAPRRACAAADARQQRNRTSERVARSGSTRHGPPPRGGRANANAAAPGGGLPLKTHSGAAFLN